MSYNIGKQDIDVISDLTFRAVAQCKKRAAKQSYSAILQEIGVKRL